MYFRTAAVFETRVVSIESWNSAEDLAKAKARADGLQRIKCPPFVATGWIYKDAGWLRPDGTPPGEDEMRCYIPRREFIWNRLTAEERKTIRTLAKENNDIAELWDHIVTSDTGIEVPVALNELSTAGHAAATQVFGKERADELFDYYYIAPNI